MQNGQNDLSNFQNIKIYVFFYIKITEFFPVEEI